jgi:hypothetical protein
MVSQFIQLRVSYILDLCGYVNTHRRTNLACPSAAYAVNRSQRDFCMLMIWNIYSSNTSHTNTLQIKFMNYNSQSYIYSINLGAAYAVDPYKSLAPRLCAE